MNDWQMKEYNELRLEKIEHEHLKYLYNRAEFIVDKMFFENVVDTPIFNGYNIRVVDIFVDKCDSGLGLCMACVDYSDGSEGWDMNEEFVFPKKWLTMSKEEVCALIIEEQLKVYSTKNEKAEQQKALSREAEIKELEEKLKQLKGES